LDRDYKIECSTKHRAKISHRSANGARRLREEKKKKKPQQNLSPLPQAIAYGRTNDAMS